MSWKKIESSNSGADVWDFDTQKEFEGEFIRKEEKVGPNNSNLYYFKAGVGVDEEEVAVWGGAVLDGRLAEVQPGTKVKIVYIGKQTSKRGNQFKNYDVFVDTEPLPF